MKLEDLFRNCPAGLTYEATIREIAMRKGNVEDIFEYGPGASTILFAKLFPNAKIHGVEHDAVWFERCKNLMRMFPNVSIALERIDSPQRNGSYVTKPMHLGLFDLIFVDGRLRADCLAVASLCLKPEGVVVLHDASRPAYHAAFKFYEPSPIKDNTIVLRPILHNKSASGNYDIRRREESAQPHASFVP